MKTQNSFSLSLLLTLTLVLRLALLWLILRPSLVLISTTLLLILLCQLISLEQRVSQILSTVLNFKSPSRPPIVLHRRRSCWALA